VTSLFALSGRLSTLDAATDWEDPGRTLRQFVRLWPAAPSADPVELVAPGAVDELVATSAALRALAVTRPRLVRGPLDRQRQFWVAPGRPGRTGTPDPARFRPVSARGRTATPTRGLYTSSGLWHLYLEQHADRFPPPWRGWAMRLEPGVRVFNVAGAADWVTLVRRFPVAHGDVVVPNWAAVARVYEGVHLTLRGVAALQGVTLKTDLGTVPGPAWEVESTLWLRWVFPSFEPAST
jgi:hypothetical protein